MMDPNEARWIKSTANELNNLLQVITEATGRLSERVPGDAAAQGYLSMWSAASHNGFAR